MKISRIIITICLYPLFSFILHAQETANFSADKTEVCIDEAVTFTNTSTGFGGTETFSWDFGANASPATITGEGSHSVTYSSAGDKTVTLIVTQDATPYPVTKTDYIKVNPIPVASFTSSQECLGTATSFDASGSTVATGTIVQYEWDFDNNGDYEVDRGSNTDATYDFGSAGTFTVGLRVTSDQDCQHTITNTATVFAYPLDNLAVSDPIICLNETASIIVSNSETTVSYQLRLELNNSVVDIKDGTGGDLTFDVTPSSTTVYNVYATTLSSTCSVELLDKSTVTVNSLPYQYEVIGGGSYCAGGDGKPVYLADSENGFSYQLQRDGTDAGSPVDGTGSSIGFGDQTAAGIYTVIATNQTTPFCQNNMSGSVDIGIDPLPTAYNVTGGGSYCAGSGVQVGLSDSETDVDYQLKVGSANTGSPVAGDGSAINFENQTTEGTYTVFATNTSTGCTNNMAVSVDVIIKPLPEAAISGGGTICQGETTDVIV